MATSRSAPPLAAFVLHSYDWSESSLVVDLFTRTQGREVVVAKGAKRPTSGFRPLLLPFHPLMAWLSRTAADEQGEVRSLRAVEWAGGLPLPTTALMSGFYLNELLLKGLPRHDPHPTLFDAYADTLAALAAAPQDEVLALRAFELVLLRELGWLPELDMVTASAEPLVAHRRYAPRADRGMMADPEGPTGATWVALQAALLHGSPAALRQACRAEVAGLRLPLRHLVHYHLSTPALRTRRIGQQLQRLAGAPAAAGAARPAVPHAAQTAAQAPGSGDHSASP
ncbi:MAG: DNA repair protein RecO [Rubrivivax sp.]|nr:DNA repair protein RecO [Rubrivivax sp.]